MNNFKRKIPVINKDARKPLLKLANIKVKRKKKAEKIRGKKKALRENSAFDIIIEDSGSMKYTYGTSSNREKRNP